MFESSLVISQELHASSGQRWTAVVSVTVQVVLAGLVIALPLLHPEPLSLRSAPSASVPLLTVFKTPKLKPVQVQPTMASTPATPTSLPTQGASFTAPPTIPQAIPHGISTDAGAPVRTFTGMGDLNGIPGGVPNLLASVGTGPPHVVAAVPTRSNDKKMRVSEGVSAGLLLAPIHPVYPAIAKATRTEGTVIVEAVISKAGRIESLRVVSGPEMLRRAAMDAIQAARYQPYTLNGEPSEVQTTITVNFRMQS